MFHRHLTTHVTELSSALTQAQFSRLGGTLVDADTGIQGIQTLFEDTRQHDGVVYLIGNGGSAAVASHIMTDLRNVAWMRALTLHESSALTCYSNDYSYEQGFSQQLQSMARAGDLLVAISSSGQSPNIVNAVTSAKNIGCRILTLSGFSSRNNLRFKGDLNVWLNSSDYGIVETGHLFFLHHLMQALTHEKTDDVTRNRIAG